MKKGQVGIVGVIAVSMGLMAFSSMDIFRGSSPAESKVLSPMEPDLESNKHGVLITTSDIDEFGEEQDRLAAKAIETADQDSFEQNANDEELTHNHNKGITEFGAQHTAEQMSALREARRQRLRVRYDTQLQRESPDPQWRAEISKRANSALKLLPQLEQAALETTECGKTLCRLRVQASDPGALPHLRRLYSGVGMVLGSEAWAYTDEVAFHTDIYLSRPGGQLPATSMP